MTYAFSTPAGASPGLLNTTAMDLAGKSATASFTLTKDATAPAGGQITYTNTITNYISNISRMW